MAQLTDESFQIWNTTWEAVCIEAVYLAKGQLYLYQVGQPAECVGRDGRQVTEYIEYRLHIVEYILEQCVLIAEVNT